jgi:mono/diheme cytochrome c family protein
MRRSRRRPRRPQIDGVPRNRPPGAMPPFSGALSDGEIDAVAQYVVEQIARKG